MPRIWLRELRGRPGVPNIILDATTPASWQASRHVSFSTAVAQSPRLPAPELRSARAWRVASRKSTPPPKARYVSSSSHINGSAAVGTLGGPGAVVNSDAPATGNPAPRGSLAVVFTDIVKSTNIWEKDPKAMIHAMYLHDRMLRGLIEENGGYEVKQNGDGFMFAFPTAGSATQFCLDVQEKLLDEHWPRGILKLPPGQETTDPDGHVLFRGLKLRMSAHWGSPVSKWNEVIERMDYLGPMVNRAARFIQVTEGGQIVVSEDFLFRLQEEMEAAKPGTSSRISTTGEDTAGRNPGSAGTNSLTTLDLNTLRSKSQQEKLTHQRFEIRLLGEHEFQGLEEPEKLYFIVPCSLEGRVEHWHQVTHVEGVKGNVRSD